MANSNILVNPWVLDTAADFTTLDVWIQRIEWKPAAADDVLLIQNRNGEAEITKVALTGTPAGDESWDYSAKNNGEGRLFCGFDLQTITAGGALYVWRTV